MICAIRHGSSVGDGNVLHLNIDAKSELTCNNTKSGGQIECVGPNKTFTLGCASMLKASGAILKGPVGFKKSSSKEPVVFYKNTGISLDGRRISCAFKVTESLTDYSQLVQAGQTCTPAERGFNCETVSTEAKAELK
jgi:hypothetical protein